MKKDSPNSPQGGSDNAKSVRDVLDATKAYALSQLEQNGFSTATVEVDEDDNSLTINIPS